jgi:hypothetical protein
MANSLGNPGNKGGGRKKLRDEIALIKYYESVLPKVFSVVSKKLNSESKKDQLWAMEWLKTGIVKMIPQKIGGDPDNRTPIPLLYALHNNNSSTKDKPA